MFRRKFLYSLAALSTLLTGAVSTFAHAGMEHVMGVVTAVTEVSVTVDTIQHKPVTVLLNAHTQFTHQDAPASWKDLQVGDRVVIHAKPNREKKLVGVTVKWGASSAGPSAHAARTK